MTVGFLQGQSDYEPDREFGWDTWDTVSSGFYEIEIGWDLWGFLPHFLPQIANGSRGSHALESAEPARARPCTPKPLSRAARIDRSDYETSTAPIPAVSSRQPTAALA
jgi:hypothetical protein